MDVLNEHGCTVFIQQGKCYCNRFLNTCVVKEAFRDATEDYSEDLEISHIPDEPDRVSYCIDRN